MHIIDHISKLPAAAVLAVTQPDGTIHVYMPGDELPPQPEASTAPVVPQTVSMRQARLALLSAGELAGVDAAIAAMPEPNRSVAKIAWEYSTEVQRTDALVTGIAAGLGMSEQQIDDLFIAAAQL